MSLLGEYQAGFREGGGDWPILFVMKECLTACHEYNNTVVVLFIDYKKAYYSVKRNNLIKVMKVVSRTIKNDTKQDNE